MTTARSVKLHISLPADLHAFVARRQQERHESMSAAVAESIRRDMLAEQQERLDAALALDAAANATFARSAGVAASRVIAADQT